MVFRISENGPELLLRLSALNIRKIKKAKVSFSPIMTDIDPVPGVTQAVLQTMSGVNGNKILLTRLFYCLPTVFISFQTLASRSLMASDSNSP